MRLTLPMLGESHYRRYKFLWVLHRDRKVTPTGIKEFLNKTGKEVETPNIKTTSFERLSHQNIEPHPYELDPKLFTAIYPTIKPEEFFPEPAAPPEPQEILYRISGEDYRPQVGLCMDLLQNLCCTAVMDQLPSTLLDRRRDVSEEEQQLHCRGILSSHLRDACQDKLPRTVDTEVSHRPEMPDQQWGIPVKRKNELLTSRMAEIFNHTSGRPLTQMLFPNRIVMEHVRASVAYRHSGHQVLLDMEHGRCVGGSALLEPVAPVSTSNLFIHPVLDEKTKRKVLRRQIILETGGPLEQPLPAIEPMLPVIGARVEDQYPAIETRYVTPAPFVFPRTIHVHHNVPLLKYDYNQLTALSLLHLYTHAVSYAVTRGLEMDSNGHLAKPFVVQCVHSHLNRFQVSLLQLNTLGPNCNLDLSSSSSEHEVKSSNIRNAFYYQKFDELFEECARDQIYKPVVTEFNTDLLALLKAVHET